MSGRTIKVRPTIEQMWKEFAQNAMRGQPQQEVPREVRASYYAGCYGMLNAMIAMLREGEQSSEKMAEMWKKWGAELAQFSHDYGEGKV